MSITTGNEAAVTRVAKLLWNAPATPPRLRAVLTNPDVHRVADLAASDMPTAALVALARLPLHPEAAALAVYLRQLPVIEKFAGQYGTAAAFMADDAHQEGALALFELIHDSAVAPEDFGDRVKYTIQNRVKDAWLALGSVTAVPRSQVRRVKFALAATLTPDGQHDPHAAAAFAADANEVEEPMTPATFWAVYNAHFAPSEYAGADVDENGASVFGTVDTRADSALADVENRLTIAQMFAWGILDKREEEILRRTYLFDGSERDTDERIGIDLGISRVRVVNIRKQALAVLRTEFEQEGLTSVA